MIRILSAEDLPLTGKQKYDIGILMHVLYNNPKVLYAPNSTMADEIINKVSLPHRVILVI